MLRKEDKRNFKRYNSASECEVTFPSGAYKGKVVDYSDGACIFIENPPDVDKGMEVNVRIFNHYLEFKGEVAWVVKTENTVRAGIRRVDNFRGNLRDFMVMDLLTGMNWSAKTGVLEIRSGATVKKVFIEKGDLDDVVIQLPMTLKKTHGRYRVFQV